MKLQPERPTIKTYLSTVILSIACAALLVLGGCATGDYAIYADSQSKIESARHAADAEKYKALASVAATGSDTARVAAVMALALGNNGSGPGGSAPGSASLRAPEANNTFLQWAGVLVPGITQAYGIHANMRLSMTQSDNSAGVARSTNDTMRGIAGLIQAPGAITNTDRHDTVTPAPVVVTPPAPVVITPVVQVVPVIGK